MEPTTPMKAIRLKCLDCCNNQINEVRNCQITGCPLYRYRSGHRPKKPQATVVFSDFDHLGDYVTADDN